AEALAQRARDDAGPGPLAKWPHGWLPVSSAPGGVLTGPSAVEDTRGRQGKRRDRGLARCQRVADRVGGRGAEAGVAAFAEAAQAERIGGGAYFLIEAGDRRKVGR